MRAGRRNLALNINGLKTPSRMNERGDFSDEQIADQWATILDGPAQCYAHTVDKMLGMVRQRAWNQLRVMDIQKIIRYYKQYGQEFNQLLRTGTTKAALVDGVQSLYDALSGRLPGYAALVHQRYIGQKRAAQSHYPATVAPGNHVKQKQKRQQQQQPQQGRPPGVAGMLIPQLNQQKLAHVNANPHKAACFKALAGFPGVSRAEVLDEIFEDQATGPMDPDAVLMQVIIKRTEKEQARREALEAKAREDDAALKAEEDRQLDAAILNSESERDVIAWRDRKRAFQLKFDHCCSLGDADEFAKSILLSDSALILYGSSSNDNNNNSTDHTRGNVLPPVLDHFDQLAMLYHYQQQADNGSDRDRSYGGDGAEETLPKYPVLMNKTLNALREAFVTLLLLEMDCLKYHAEYSRAYLERTRNKISTAVYKSFPTGIDLLSAGEESESGSSSSSTTIATTTAVSGAALLTQLLTCESNFLRPHLYGRPADGGIIPIIFRDSPKLDLRIDEDGLEVTYDTQFRATAAGGGVIVERGGSDVVGAAAADAGANKGGEDWDDYDSEEEKFFAKLNKTQAVASMTTS